MTLLIGAALQNGHYVLDSVTHQDDAGASYRGTHVTSGQVVSVKLLRDNLPQGLDSFLLRAELIDQIQRLAQLQHPNIVDHLFCFEENDLVFVVMEADVGLSLAQIVGFKRPRPLAEATALRYLHQIADAVLAIRKVGLRSLDLDPRFIFRKPGTHRIVLAGLGVSLVAPLAEVKSLQTPLNGSAQDAYPDNLQTGQTLTTSDSDVYRLSALFYYLLTGNLTPLERQIHQEAELWPPHRRPQISEATEQAIQRGLGLPNQAPICNLKDWLTLLPDVADIRSESSPETSQFQTAANPEITSAIKPNAPSLQAPSVNKVVSLVADETAPRFAPSKASSKDLLASPRSSRRFPQLFAPGKPSVKFVKRGTKIRNAALVMTMFVSALMGLGFGTVLRFTPPRQAGGIRFDPDQSFPPLEDWQEDEPGVNFDAPYLPAEQSLAGQSAVRRLDTTLPDTIPSGTQPIENPEINQKEFNWIDKESIIPDYPTPKQPNSPLGWSVYPETVSPAPPLDAAASASPNADSSPSTSPTLSSLIETPPAAQPSQALRNQAGSSLPYSVGSDESGFPIPAAPTPVAESPPFILETIGESQEDANSTLQD
ncbi:MAG: hypothetical protein QNJ46_00745 [Leptolyngbyaceae cyanobacterium MO_188.B28]|nr:hypothetical protein [Leptolyngbyaceae cyanobacterium MO_188.B28]